MANVLLEKYDIFYTNPAGTKEQGFMLAKDRNGVKAWSRRDERGLPDSFAPGDIEYANLPPDIQKVIQQEFLHGGIGAVKHETSQDAAFNTMRCLKSVDVDTRCKGKFYPGPKIIQLASPNFEDPTGFVDPAPDWVDEEKAYDNNLDTFAYSGHANAPSWTEFLELTKPEGIVDAVRFYAGQSGASITQVDIDLYYDAAWNHLYEGVFTINRWITKVLPVQGKTVTAARLRFYRGEGANIFAYLYEFDFYNRGKKATSNFCVFNNALYHVQKDILSKLKASENRFEPVWGFLYDITHLESMGNYLLVGQGVKPYYFSYAKAITAISKANPTIITVAGHGLVTGDIVTILGSDSIPSIDGTRTVTYISVNTFSIPVNVTTAGTTGTVLAEYFTASTLIPNNFNRFKKVGAGIYGCILPNTVRRATDPTNAGAWGAAITVGESAYNINDMQAYRDMLYCKKQNGTFIVDAAGAVTEPFPDLRTASHADAGKNSDVFRGCLYFRMGNLQEWEINQTTLNEVTPANLAVGVPEYAEPCVARSSDEAWLYALMYRGANNIGLLAGRNEDIAGAARWIWHDIRKITLITNASCALVSSVEGRPYLYVGSTADGESVQKIYLPVCQDATADAGYRFTTSGLVYSPRYTTLLIAMMKRWIEFYGHGENLSATKTVKVYSSIDDGVNYALKGTMDANEKIVTLTLDSTKLHIYLSFTSDSDSMVPVIKYFNLKAVTLVPSVVRFNHAIRCPSLKQVLKNNQQSNVEQTTLIAFVNSLRDNICTLGDIDGNEHIVKVRVAREDLVFDEDNPRHPEYIYQIEATKI